MSYWNTNIPAGTFGDFTGVPGKYTFPSATGFNIPEFTADIPAGTFGSFPGIDGSAAGQAAFGGAAGGGLGSWGGMQAVGGIVNTLTNQLANREGTTAGQNYLDFMADKRDADAGAAVWERNADIADQFKIARLIDKYRANDPNRRQANRAADLGTLAGKYGQLGGFLA
jgi:hypothetical protein